MDPINRTAPSSLTLLVLGLGGLISLASLVLALWGWDVLGALQARLGQAVTQALTLPGHHPLPVHPEFEAPHPWVAALGLGISLVALISTIWFAERQARQGELA